MAGASRPAKVQFTADVLIAAPGFLSEPSTPALPGLETFAGATFHTARWNHDHDLTGRRVAVLGTGASAIQAVPEIQPIVEHLDRVPAHAAVGDAAPRPADHATRAAHVPALSCDAAPGARRRLLEPRADRAGARVRARA